MLRLLCITAHPDDEAGGFGGSLLVCADRGIETHVLCLTPGQAASHRGNSASNDELAAMRRREFAAFSAHSDDVPDPQALETFERSKLVWNECSRAPHAEMLDWHRRLIRLRHEFAALSDGRLDRVTVSFDEQAKWLVMARGPIAVACNLSECRQRTPLSTGKNARILLGSEKEIQLVGDSVELLPDSVAIVEAIGNRPWLT